MSEQVAFNEIKIYSFGDILVGLDKEEFTETEEILEIRRSISKIAEMLKENYNQSKSPVKSLLFDQAIGQITAAQLIVEKLLNMK
jgi:hypothetical protein